MIGKELDAWLAQERKIEYDRWRTARCLLCGKDNSHPATLLSYTNDLQHFICAADRHLDRSKLDIDVTADIAIADYTERMYGRPLFTREHWILEYKQMLAQGRYNPINVPAWLLQAVHKQETQPGQMSLFEESEVQDA